MQKETTVSSQITGEVLISGVVLEFWVKYPSRKNVSFTIALSEITIRILLAPMKSVSAIPIRVCYLSTTIFTLVLSSLGF